MSKINDEVQLARKCERWPVEMAEKLLASPLPWGPPTYALGIGYADAPNQPDQADDFIALAHCVDGAYKRHGDIGEAWDWANPIIKKVKEGSSCAEYATQDLLDIVFLYARSERFSDGLIRAEEPMLREMVREVIRRLHASPSPVFLRQE